MLARIALVAALALSIAPVQADPVLRIYDTRDLAAVLPSGASGGTISVVPRLVTDGSGPGGANLMLDVQHTVTNQAAGSPTDLVMSRLCGQLDLQKEALVDGVYVVTGEADRHEQLVKLLDDVRALYQGSYEFELFTYPVAAAQAPPLGTSADAQAATIRSRQVVSRRVETHIAITEEITYVSDWQPVVGNESVGYDPSPTTVTSGLRLTVTAGAPGAPDSNGSSGTVQLRVSGEWTDVVIEKQASSLAPVSGGPLELGLPRITARSIESDVRVHPGQASVLAVVPGSKQGESIVIAGTLREMH